MDVQYGVTDDEDGKASGMEKNKTLKNKVRPQPREETQFSC